VTAGRIHLFPVAEVTTRMSLLIVFAGFFEGFGHGLMGKSGFGYSKIALGCFAAFGRNFAQQRSINRSTWPGLHAKPAMAATISPASFTG
jgi:hypothetical protein